MRPDALGQIRALNLLGIGAQHSKSSAYLIAPKRNAGCIRLIPDRQYCPIRKPWPKSYNRQKAVNSSSTRLPVLIPMIDPNRRYEGLIGSAGGVCDLIPEDDLLPKESALYENL